MSLPTSILEHDLLDDQDNAHYLGESLLALDDDNTKKGKKKRDMANLRKAPNAPKRFKSSYICFFMENQSMIKKELGDEAGVTSISKRSAEKWKSLSVEERVHWEEVAAKDKQRYLVEKSQYTGPWQVPWKRVRKDPSAPKRPMSAFLYYSQVKRSQLKVEHPDVKNTDLSRMLGELWRQLPEQERSPHVDREKIERDKYKIAIAAWREENARTTLQVQADHALMYGESFESQHASMMNAYTFPGYHASDFNDSNQFPVPLTPGKQPVILGPTGLPYASQTATSKPFAQANSTGDDDGSGFTSQSVHPYSFNVND